MQKKKKKKSIASYISNTFSVIFFFLEKIEIEIFQLEVKLLMSEESEDKQRGQGGDGALILEPEQIWGPFQPRVLSFHKIKSGFCCCHFTQETLETHFRQRIQTLA